MNQVRFFLFVFLAFLVSCKPVVVTKTVTSTNDNRTPTTNLVSSVKTVSPTVILKTLTPHGNISSTIIPQILSLSVNSLNITKTLTPSPSASPTDFIGTPDPVEMLINRWKSTSPDAKWIAEGIHAFPKPSSSFGMEYFQLIVQNVIGLPRWIVIDRWNKTGLGGSIPRPVGWREDRKYFYFTNQPSIEGCLAINPNSSDLYSVEAETGRIDEVLGNFLYWISLSPDNIHLAYFGAGDIFIKELDTGNEKSTSIYEGESYEPGYFIWSPDGKELALTLANFPCTGDYVSGLYAQSTSILMVNISTMQVTTLIKDDQRRFVTVSWVDQNHIQLDDAKENRWILNVQTGQITKK
jgi:hypothetical protein